MKKAFLLLSVAALTFVACHKDPQTPPAASDASLSGEKVDVSKLSAITKLFVLNEGNMGSNDASLDMLRISDGNYINGVFKKMNPEEPAGLGDVGNDIAVIGDEIWLTVNNSGILEVLSAENEREIAAITLPMPRSIAFDEKYVYVSSWNGAAAVYAPDWSVDVEKSNNVKGAVYRVDRASKQLSGSVSVGWQPEGLAVYDGKLYVANSGGVSHSLPPDYAYDKSVSVIDLSTFKLVDEIEVEINLQKLFSDGKGNLYVNTFGNYSSVHSALWRIKLADKTVSKVSDYAYEVAFLDGTVYCYGNENEFDYTAPVKPVLWKCTDGVKSEWTISLGDIKPYGLAALPGGNFIVTESDYSNPGTLNFFHDGARLWSVTTGVNPRHFALY